jgi:hypothetical protein
MSEEREQLPDWLLSMRGQSFNEPLSQQGDLELPQEEPPQQEAASPFAQPLVEPAIEEPAAEQEQLGRSDSDMVDILRDMVDSSEEFPGYSGRREEKVGGVIPGMRPWQSLVLAILFALDVLVCGAMALAMLGRIGF